MPMVDVLDLHSWVLHHSAVGQRLKLTAHTQVPATPALLFGGPAV